MYSTGYTKRKGFDTPEKVHRIEIGMIRRLPKTERLKVVKTVQIQTCTSGDTKPTYKVTNGMEMNKDMMNHSFHSINSKTHIVSIYLGRLKKKQRQEVLQRLYNYFFRLNSLGNYRG